MRSLLGGRDSGGPQSNVPFGKRLRRDLLGTRFCQRSSGTEDLQRGHSEFSLSALKRQTEHQEAWPQASSNGTSS